MNPQSHALWLIQTAGVDKALDHARWAVKQAIKPETRRFWSEVVEELEKRKVKQCEVTQS